jgi:hypothetical protein
MGKLVILSNRGLLARKMMRSPQLVRLDPPGEQMIAVNPQVGH